MQILEPGSTLLSKRMQTKYLGIMLHDKLNFRNHGDQVKDKMKDTKMFWKD